MEDELIEPVPSLMRDRRTSSPPRPAYELLDRLGVKNPGTVNSEYGWRRPGFTPSIILTIWTEFVELDKPGAGT